MWGEVRWGDTVGCPALGVAMWGDVRWGAVRCGEVRWGNAMCGEGRGGDKRWGEVGAACDCVRFA